MRSMAHPPQGAPVQKKQNLAARAGQWSAQHRKKAIFGWLAFVIAALFIGGSRGTKTIPQDEDGVVGESHQAAQIVKDHYPQTAPEMVLVQSKTGSPADAGFRSAVRDVESRLRAQKDVINVKH